MYYVNFIDFGRYYAYSLGLFTFTNQWIIVRNQPKLVGFGYNPQETPHNTVRGPELADVLNSRHAMSASQCVSQVKKQERSGAPGGILLRGYKLQSKSVCNGETRFRNKICAQCFHCNLVFVSK